MSADLLTIKLSKGGLRSYRVLSVLGEGSEGIAIQVVDSQRREIALKLNRQAISKVLPNCRALVTYQSTLTRNQEDSAIRGILRHYHGNRYMTVHDLNCDAARKVPIIPKVGSSGTVDYNGLSYTVTELSVETKMPFSKQGPTRALLRMAKDPRMLWRSVIIITHQMISRLKWVHEAGYLHCDPNIENWLLARHVEPASLLLIDFGFAMIEKYALANRTRATDLHTAMHRAALLLVDCRAFTPHNRKLGVSGLPPAQLEPINECLEYLKTVGKEKPDYDKLKGIWKDTFEKEGFTAEGPLIY